MWLKRDLDKIDSRGSSPLSPINRKVREENR